MFFHIDESGNTGLNLFDEHQPKLSYGVLSSRLNVDVLGCTLHKRMLKVLGVDYLHANELGIGGISQIAGVLLDLQKKHRFGFDYYFIEKLDYALVQFFEAVFDAGLNEAVKWDMYWTPLRYVAIHKLSILFDEDLLKESWSLCTSKNIEKHGDRIIALLQTLKSRVSESILDARTKELFTAALSFGIKNPLSLDFGFPDVKIVSPNIVGFQFVVHSVARRSKGQKQGSPSRVVIDSQQQFNKSQIKMHDILRKGAEGIRSSSPTQRQSYLNHPLFNDIENSELELEGLPEEDIIIRSSKQSIGLQIVDVYLWIASRVLSGDDLPVDIQRLANSFLKSSTIDGISLEGMGNRFSNFEKTLPSLNEFSDEEIQVVRDGVASHRDKVKKLLK